MLGKFPVRFAEVGMSVRMVVVGWIVVGVAACNGGTESPLAPKDAGAPNVPIQAGPPPTGSNNLPIVTVTAPVNGAALAANSTVQLSADFTDQDVSDTHTCSVDWQLAAGPGTDCGPRIVWICRPERRSWSCAACS